jgi:hypothetical protein
MSNPASADPHDTISCPPTRGMPVPAASASGSNSPVTGPAPARAEVTISVASASPYAGRIASPRNPVAANASVNRRSDAARIGSDALTTTRHRDRSSPAASAGATLRTDRSNPKFGAIECVPPNSAIAVSQRNGRAANALGVISTVGIACTTGSRPQ